MSCAVDARNQAATGEIRENDSIRRAVASERRAQYARELLDAIIAEKHRPRGDGKSFGETHVILTWDAGRVELVTAVDRATYR